MKISTTLLLALLAHVSSAQYFVQQLPQDQILQNDQAYVILNDDTRLEGRITNTTMNGGLLISFTLNTGTERLKFKIEDVKTLAIVPSVMARYVEMPLITTLKNASDTTFLRMVETNWVIYDRIKNPTSATIRKVHFTQLLNPGFDQKLKVYKSMDGGTTTELSAGNTSLMGGLDAAHYVSVAGADPVLVQKRKYTEAAAQFYAGCDQILAGELEWNDFAKHVFIHTTQCE